VSVLNSRRGDDQNFAGAEKMNLEEFELQRVESDSKFIRKITTIFATVIAIGLDVWTVYSAQYYLDFMKYHPNPENLWIVLGITVTIAVVINVLTLLFYLKQRNSYTEEL